METIEQPRRIFKYTSSEIAKIVIANSSIKFSQPVAFNDPFDCDVDLIDFRFNSESELDIKIQEEIKILKENFKNAPGFAELSKDKTFWERGYKETQIGKIQSCLISCFSLLNDSILMWSHYAEKHFGVCLEFDNYVSPRFSNLSDENDITEGVVGYSEYERINYMNSDRRFAIFKLFLSKSSSWSHEKEYRMILVNNKSEIQKFNTPFLKAVYFGLRTSDETIDEIISLCKTQGFQNLEFFKCKKDNLSITFTNI